MARKKSEIKRAEHGRFAKGTPGGPGRKPLAVTLATHIRDIGSEVIDAKTGWTRLDMLIRRLYNDAKNGRTAASALILERGWGRVMQPVEVSWRDEARKLVSEGKLTPDGIRAEFGTMADDLVAELFFAQREEADIPISEST